MCSDVRRPATRGDARHGELEVLLRVETSVGDAGTDRLGSCDRRVIMLEPDARRHAKLFFLLEPAFVFAGIGSYYCCNRHGCFSLLILFCWN